MDIEMQEYWSRHKVFLFGQLAFLPDDLENKVLTQKKLRHYFPAESEEELEGALNEYQQQSYFTVKTIVSADEPKQYIIGNVDYAKFHDELVDYLNKIRARLPTERREALWSAATKQYKEHGYRPTIRWKDIYGDSSRTNYEPPFWELIFTPVVLGQTKLVKITYDRVLPYLQSSGGLKEMPKEMLQFYARPRAEFEVLDKVLQQRIAKPHQTIERKATISLRSGRKLMLLLGMKRHTIWEYSSVNSNTYRTASALYGSSKPLAIDELNLKPNTKTALKDLLSNAGFKGIVRELFIEVGRDKERDCEVVLLKRSVSVSEEQYERLLEFVKTKNAKSE